MLYWFLYDMEVKQMQCWYNCLQSEEPSSVLWSIFPKANSRQTLITGKNKVKFSSWHTLHGVIDFVIRGQKVFEQALPPNDFQKWVKCPSMFFLEPPSKSWNVSKTPLLRLDNSLPCGPVVTSNAPNPQV